MDQIGYAALERFGPESKDRWRDIRPDSTDAWSEYVAWAKLPQLSRVVSLDGILCHSVVKTPLIDEDWNHILLEDFGNSIKAIYFQNLDYLTKRANKEKPFDIVALIREPGSPYPHGFQDDRFDFAGYDLFDGSVSLLVNCGGFPDCFDNVELNAFGLLPSLNRAREVKQALRTRHPEEHHAAECDVWALWLMKG